MATYIKFLAGDYGKEEYIYIKNKNQLRCSSKMFGAKELFLSSIASCEVANEESVKKLGGTLGGRACRRRLAWRHRSGCGCGSWRQDN